MVDSKITVDDFEEICRTCLCDCTNKASFQLHSFMIFEKVVLGDVLSNCASIKVSFKLSPMFYLDLSYI